MLYIAREIYHAFKRRYTIVYLIGFLILCVLANVAMTCFRTIYGMNDGAFSYNLIIFAEGVFAIPYYSCICFADIVFGRSYIDPHIKDKYTKTLRPWQLYLGKLLAAVVLATVLFFVSFVMLIAVTALFGTGDTGIDLSVIVDFMDKASMALPLWIAGIAIGQMFLFLFDRCKKAYILFFVTVLVIPRLIMLLAFEVVKLQPFVAIRSILITPQFQELQFFYTQNRLKCWLTGLIYTAIASAVGIYAFYKRTRREKAVP